VPKTAVSRCSNMPCAEAGLFNHLVGEREQPVARDGGLAWRAARSEQ